jgi:diadenosine tetraphosphatase ApaH/serine/threonine PP2A family protein phosphatase
MDRIAVISDIHSTYLKTFQHRILFNVGSVGNPLDLTQASYALLEGVYGSSAAQPFTVQFIRVPYDIERAIRDAEQAQMPELQAYIQELRTARYRGAPQPAA